MVTWAFYVGAAILLVCVVYTFAKVKEMPPAEYALFHGIKDEKTGKERRVHVRSEALPTMGCTMSPISGGRIQK